MAGDPPIIINGGSITIVIPGGLFQGLTGGTFSNQQKEIKRIEITGGGIRNYDESATGGDITIKIHYANP